MSNEKKSDFKWKTLATEVVNQAQVDAAEKQISAWAWRVFKPTIDSDTCKKCWTCVDYCPEGVIMKTDDGPKIDYQLCKGCGVCANECPFKAIKMERE
jgi:2-oxoacid:acceptor oxidoreductase delta subunit (pyruvate/2-ketoisovalerate family)